MYAIVVAIVCAAERVLACHARCSSVSRASSPSIVCEVVTSRDYSGCADRTARSFWQRGQKCEPRFMKLSRTIGVPQREHGVPC